MMKRERRRTWMRDKVRRQTTKSKTKKTMMQTTTTPMTVTVLLTALLGAGTEKKNGNNDAIKGHNDDRIIGNKDTPQTCEEKKQV